VAFPFAGAGVEGGLVEFPFEGGQIGDAQAHLGCAACHWHCFQSPACKLAVGIVASHDADAPVNDVLKFVEGVPLGQRVEGGGDQQLGCLCCCGGGIFHHEADGDCALLPCCIGGLD